MARHYRDAMKLFLWVFASICAATLEVFNIRNLGLDQLFSSIDDKFLSLVPLHAMDAMAWCLRHGNLKLMRKVARYHHDLVELDYPYELYMNVLLRFFSPDVKRALTQLIQSRWNSGKTLDRISELIKILEESADLVETSASCTGSFSILPHPIPIHILDHLGPEDALNMIVTSWGMRDALAPEVRKRFFHLDKYQSWHLSLAKVYGAFMAVDASYRSSLELFLIKNYQAVLLWGYLVNGEPFNYKAWRQFYKCDGFGPYESFTNWLSDCGATISYDILSTVLSGPVADKVTWKDYEAAIDGDMGVDCVAKIVDAIPVAALLSSEHFRYAYRIPNGPQVLIPMIQSRLESCTMIDSETSLELMLRNVRSSSALLTVLSKIPINKHLVPTHKTKKIILNQTEECFSMFVKKFPATVFTGAQWQSAVNSGFSAEFLSRLLLLVPTHEGLNVRIFDELTKSRRFTGDAFIILVCRADFGFLQRHIVHAMKNGVQESAMRLMLLKSRRTLDARDLAATIVCAATNGYSEELIALIKEIYI